MKEYPLYKIIAWRFFRVFIATFLGTIAILLPELDNANDFYKIILLPAIVASISAIGKLAREYNLTDKSPI